MECDRTELLKLRHRLQDLAWRNRDRMPLDDEVLEADETYQNAGKKGIPHTDPEDPPRRRANKARGHGTWETDQPPVPGVIGRQSGRLWIRVGHRSGSAELVDATVLPATEPGAMVYTDDWYGYKPVGRNGRGHATVNHNQGEFARDDDGAPFHG